MSNETRIYIGNLPPDIRSKDIEDLFYKYGKIIFIDLKNRDTYKKFIEITIKERKIQKCICTNISCKKFIIKLKL